MNIRHILTFNSKENAKAFLIKVGMEEYKTNRFCTKGIYELRHGKYERPDYSIRKIRGTEQYGIYARYYFYPGTFNAKWDGYLTEEETFGWETSH